NRRQKSPFVAGTESSVTCNHRHWQRRSGETRSLFAREFVVSAGDPLHRGGARFRHRRADFNSRLGGPSISRLVFQVIRTAGHFHSAFVPRFGTSMVNLEVWKEATATEVRGQSFIIGDRLSDVRN